MLKPILLLTILIRSLAGQCSVGCQACGPNRQCLYCDGTRGFYLNANTCAATNKTNCTLLGDTGACLVCQSPGFYLDATTQECVAVPSNTTVPNCSVHSGPSSCSSCQTGFFPANSSSCQAVNVTISNCAIYDADASCLSCAKGFDLNRQHTACTPTQGPNNCSLSSQTKCLRCKSGFYHSSAASLASLQQTAFTGSVASSIARAVVSSQGLGTLPLPVCFGTVDCLEYSPTDFTCTRCRSGFSYNATSQTCFQNPLPRVIDFCELYATATTCAKCLSGFFRASATSCTPFTNLTDCLTYDTSASVPKCLTCASTSYLTPAGNCSARLVFNKTNCLTYAPDADACTSCAPLYQLTTDQKSCLPSIASCLVYAFSSAESSYLVCSKCSPGAYKVQQGRLCAQGSVLNCEAYQEDANVCTSCANGFRLVNQACVPVTTISFCAVYSRITDRKCNTCNANAAKFTIQTGCSPATPIPNCRVYSTRTTCATCQDGYQLANSATSCTPVNVPNCERYRSDACIQCKAGFYFVGGVCSTPSPQDTVNCDTTVLTGTYAGETPVGCRRCNSQSVPFDIANMAYCLPETVLVAANSAALDPNCNAWRLSGATYVCLRCVAGYFNSNGVCQATCGGANPQKYSFLLPTMATAGKYTYSENFLPNACSAFQAVTNCEWVTPAVQQPNSFPTYGCPACVTGAMPFVTFSASSVLKTPSTSPQDTLPGLSSCNLPVSSVLGVPTNSLMTNCAFYHSYPTYNKNACIGCTFGNTGVVRTEISRCVTYTGTTCLQCAKGYHPAADQLSCVADSAIDGCAYFDARSVGTTKCLYCTLNTHYQQGTGSSMTCTPRTPIADCATYNELKNECVACSTTSLIYGMCGTTIPNCLSYGPLAASPFVECIACDDTNSFRAMSTGATPRYECTSVTPISNCLRYSQASGVASSICVTCQNSYILSNNQCLSAEPALSELGICQASNGKSCTTCYKSSLKFTVRKVCKPPASPIADCVSYSSPTVCQLCAAGKYLQSPTVCADIPASVNCQEYVPVIFNYAQILDLGNYFSGVTDFTCNVCKSGYLAVNSTLTSGSITYGKTTCVAEADSATDCPANSRIYSLDGKYVCMPNSYLSSTANFAADPNCIIYRKFSFYACFKCAPGYVTDGGLCYTDCGSSNRLSRYIIARFMNGYNLQNTEMCSGMATAALLPENCIHMVPQYVPPANPQSFISVCTQCKAGYRGLITFSLANKGWTAFNPTSTTTSASIDTFMTPHQEISSCVLASSFTDTMTSGGRTVDSNCEQFGPIPPNGETDYPCQRCKDGFVGKIKKRIDGQKDLAVVYDCQPDPEFTSFVPTDGFNYNEKILNSFGPIRSIFSNFACSAAAKVPVAFLALSDTTPFGPLGWFHWADMSNSGFAAGMSLASFAADSATATADAPTIKCVDMTSTTELAKYLAPEQSAGGNVVANCALYIINTNTPVKSDSPIDPTQPAGKALICVACKPGFTPTHSAVGVWNVISACTAITGCSNPGTAFNICSTCAFVRTTDPLIDYSKCAANAPANCFAADIADQTKCGLCKRDYNGKTDRTGCVLISTLQGCDSFQFVNEFTTVMNNVIVGKVVTSPTSLIPYYTYRSVSGCRSCQAGYTQTLVNLATDSNIIKKICVPDSLGFVPSGVSGYNIANCATYNFKWTSATANVVSCSLCADGYLVLLNVGAADTCVTAASISSSKKTGCEYWDGTAQLCLRCKKVSFILFTGLCVPSGSDRFSLYTCEKWSSDTIINSSTLQCQGCPLGYQVSGATCALVAATGLANCATTSGGTCTSCMPGYVLATVGGSLTCFKLVSGTPSATTPTPHDSQCLILSGTAWESFNLDCTTCAPNFFLTDPVATDIANYCYEIPAYKNFQNCASFVAPGSAFSAAVPACARCPSNENFYLSVDICRSRTAASTGVLNCGHFSETSDACQSCAATFTYNVATTSCQPYPAPYTNVGFVVANNPWVKDFYPNARGYLETCSVPITDCNTGVKYLGLEAPFALVLSCHKCTTAGKIPFGFVFAGNGTYAGVSGLFSWNTNSTSTVSLGYYEDEVSVKCLTPDAASFHPSFSGKFSFPANCALGIANIWGGFDASHSAQSTAVDKSKVAVMCVACPPGYKPTGATDTSGTSVSGMVSACSPIANCASSSAFNKCEVCAANYAFKLDASGNIDRTNCVLVPVALTNCRLLTSTNDCALCSDGYFQNLDGVCEPLHAPNCFYSNSQSQSTLNGVNIIEALYLQPFKGCTACVSGFVPALNSASNLVCHVSDLINSARPANSKFAANCALYTRAINPQKQVLCDVCKPGFVMTTVGSCIATTDSNCRVAVSASLCSVCFSSAQLLINGVCTTPNIPNCASYSTAITTAVVCVECLPAFRLVNNQCLQGSILGCASYTSQGICSQCLPDFVIKRDSSGTVSCVQAPTTMNCLTMDDSLFDQYQFGCLVCQPQSFPNPSPLNQDICIAFEAVAGCVSYDVGLRVSLSTQKCTACVSSMYLNPATRLCVNRTAASLTKCLVASPTSDVCVTPLPETVPTSPNTPPPITPMNPQPTGIANCLVYNGSLKCIQCSSTTYFNGTYCVQVPADSLVTNCAAYNSSNSCTKCVDGYILRVGLCVGLVGANCGSVDQARGDCLTCNSGFGLFDQNGFNTCVKLNDTNCAKWAPVAPYPCVLCSTGFALVGNSCAPLNQTVPNCQFHSADNVCVECASGFTLNTTDSANTASVNSTNSSSVVQGSTTVCVRTSSLTLLGFMDPNCDSFAFTPLGSCYLCSAGFTLQNGTCVACNSSQGCLVCDSLNSSKCLLCQSDYFSYGNGSCLPNAAAAALDRPGGSDTNQTEFFPGSAQILQSIVLLAISMAAVAIFRI